MPPETTELGRWFSEHLQPHEAMLRAWLQSRFKGSVDVDDVVQEAYLRVMKAKGKGSMAAPKAFLFATARNIALNMVRAAGVRGENELELIDDCDIIDDAANVQEMVAKNQELEILTRAIQSLPDRCRQVFTLRKVYGLKQREIAKKLGISPRTVNAQISVGVDRCAAFVRDYCRRGV